MKYIILSAQEKNAFKQSGDHNDRFGPVELKDGTWVLPESVLQSPNIPKGLKIALEAKSAPVTVKRLDFKWTEKHPEIKS